MLKIVYRISEAGYSKVKPSYIENRTCFLNACKVFPPSKYEWHVIADTVSDVTRELLESILPESKIDYVNIANGPGYPFMKVLNYVLENYNDSDVVYFIENDYLHRMNSDKVLLEGTGLGADYVTLYDHPDKYMDPEKGGNPYVEDRGEVSRVYLTDTCHWKLTNSTTGTFAAKVKTLKRDYDVINKYANNVHWSDFYMFTELLEKGVSLVSPLPGYSTHGESAWLTPLVDWEIESKNII